MIKIHPIVAIVDDDPSIRRGLRRLLQTQCWEVCTYASAEEFLDRGQEPKIDLAFVDIYLPGLSGIELLKRMTSDSERPAVILMTAYGESETAEILHTAGPISCLRKPFTLQELLDAALQFRWVRPNL